MSESATQAPTHEVILTDVAAAKVKSLLEQEGRDDLRLRIAVQPGGCSGLIYQLYFDDRTLDGDAIRSFDGVEVVVDRMSVPYLSGATIDFADTIERQGFTIDEPQRPEHLRLRRILPLSRKNTFHDVLPAPLRRPRRRSRPRSRARGLLRRFVVFVSRSRGDRLLRLLDG